MSNHTYNHTYKKLSDRLSQFACKVPVGNSFPNLLEELYTQEEAETAIAFPPGLFTLAELSEKLRKDREPLKTLLETMTDKGQLFDLDSDDGEKRYELAPWFPGVIEFSMLRRFDNPEALARFNKLLGVLREEAFALKDEYSDDLEKLRELFPPAQLRTIVLEENIEAENTVYSHENVLAIVEKEESFAAMPCCCREQAEAMNDPCKHTDIPKYSCMSFGIVADYVVKHNYGIRLTKEECKDLIKIHAKTGVIFNTNNFTEGIQYLCGCCGCCCGSLNRIKALGNLNEVATSNFISSIDADSCTGCGECVERCPVDAISLEDDIATVSAEICLGCASCVPVCPVECTKMERTENKKPEIGERVIGLGSSMFLK